MCGYLGLGAAILVWVTRRPARTLTGVTAWLVVTHCTHRARVHLAFVDVHTAGVSPRVAGAAQTLGC